MKTELAISLSRRVRFVTYNFFFATEIKTIRGWQRHSVGRNRDIEEKIFLGTILQLELN